MEIYHHLNISPQTTDQGKFDQYLNAVIKDFNKCQINHCETSETINTSMEIEQLDDQSRLFKVLAIDVGIKNLGLAFSIFNEDMTINKFNDVQLIDITLMRHKKTSRRDCKLHHDNCISDWISHVFQEYSWFDEADYIIVERQPIQGIVSVEQVIMHQFRNKTILVSPTSMHQYFNIAQHEYEKRKEFTTKIALYMFDELKTDPIVIDKFKSYSRCHDIADAVCFTVFWSQQQNKKYKIKHRKERIAEIIKRGIKNCTMDEWFEQYMCKRVS